MKKVLFLSALLTLLFTGYALAGEFTWARAGIAPRSPKRWRRRRTAIRCACFPGEHLESEENYPIVVEKSVAIAGEEGAVLAGRALPEHSGNHRGKRAH